MSEVILDVREKDEYEAEHVARSIHVPLSRFAAVAPGVLSELPGRDVLVLCRSGARAKLAVEQIRNLGYADQVRAKVFEGGILEWKRMGRPTIVRRKHHLPILRQVQLVAGTAILAATLLGIFVNPTFHYMAGAFGIGLSIAGATGFCGMAVLLSKMPWNRNSANLGEELCQASPGASTCRSD